MSSLHKRCFCVSIGFHSLLLLLAFVGSGFLGSHRETETLPVLTFIPDKLVDLPVVGGGKAGPPPQAIPSPPAATTPIPTPTPKPPPSTPPKESESPAVTSKSTPPPEKIHEPAKPVASVQKSKPAPVEPESFSDAVGEKPRSTKRVADVNLKPVARKSSNKKEKEAMQRAQAQADAEAEAAARSRQRQADERRNQVQSALRDLQGRLSSSSTDISLSGPGAASYASYSLYVRSVYDWAWQPPDEVADDASTVKARIVIARDGKVLSSEVTTRSDIAALDRSVRAALDRVTDIGKPFPEGAREERRAFIINFNLKAKRANG